MLAISNLLLGGRFDELVREAVIRTLTLGNVVYFVVKEEWIKIC